MTILRLASCAEARAVLAAEDDFTRTLGSFDRSFRLRTTEPVSDAALRAFLGEQALDFTADEATVWEEAITTVAIGAQGLAHLFPPEVLVVKSTGREERDHAYTRANAIVLPAARVRSLRGEYAFRLLAHELFHVASRASPALRDATYALLGFTRMASITPPPELDARRLTNPDAHTLEHSVRLGERSFVPLLTCPLPLADVLEQPSVLGVMRPTLLAVDPEAGAVLRDGEGSLLVVDAAGAEWTTRLARNTTYIIHPEEVLADNLSLVVRRRLGTPTAPTDLAFLAAFEAALAEHTSDRRT